MTEASFDRLLALFSEDRAAAGERYEALRLRLSDFFRYAQVADPDAAADLVFDRVATKLEEGVAIENVNSYVLAVARFVRQENWNAAKRERAALVQMPPRLVDPPASTVEREHRCLDGCLAHWSPADRDFLIRYYQGDGSARIRQRQNMASEEGISVNAVRNRALRLRDRLESCLHNCLSDHHGDGKANSRTLGKRG